MKSILFTFQILLSINIYAQEYLIVSNGVELFIIDYDTKEKLIFFDSYNFKEKIDITKLYGYNLVGYHWQSDSLITYIEKSGVVTYNIYKLSTLKPIPESNAEFFTTNLDALYYVTNNDETIYQYKEIKLITDGRDLICYIDSNLIWKKRCSSYTGSIAMGGLGYYMPVLSPDKKNILVQKNKFNLILLLNKSKLVEINLSTGNETKIKSRCFNYSYSPSGRYILYKKGKKSRLCIYDKNGKNETIHYSWNKAFWLYK